ncbi:MAG: IS21 family transposase [Burkholderiales bacterium]
MHLVDGVPKKEVARRFDLDIKTVRRAIERSELRLDCSTPQRPRKLDPCREKIVELLQSEPRITAKRIGRLLGDESGGIRERALREYVHDLRRELFAVEAFVHRTHQPGDTLEGDFFENWVRIAGRLCKAKVFVGTLPSSNSYFAKAYPLERLECLFDGLTSSFECFGGVPRRAVLDNTSLAVKKILPGPEREETKAFHGWRGCFPLQVDFCAPAKGNEKGSVERGNAYVRGLFFRPLAEASSWDELNAALQAELDRDLDQRRLPDGRTAREALIAEREHLRPLPPRLPESCRIVACVADKYAIVTVDRSRYSVPSDLTRRALLAKIFWDRIEIVDSERCVAVHARSYVEGDHVLDAMHVLRLLERKHRAVTESTAVQQLKLAPVFVRLREALRGKVRKPDREWVRVLRLLEEHSMEELECAVGSALERVSPSLETIRMLLRHQASETPAIAPAEVASAALAAIEVAPADLEGYDQLVGGAA